jgi:hypothetical protein
MQQQQQQQQEEEEEEEQQQQPSHHHAVSRTTLAAGCNVTCNETQHDASPCMGLIPVLLLPLHPTAVLSAPCWCLAPCEGSGLMRSASKAMATAPWLRPCCWVQGACVWAATSKQRLCRGLWGGRCVGRAPTLCHLHVMFHCVSCCKLLYRFCSCLASTQLRNAWPSRVHTPPACRAGSRPMGPSVVPQ